MVSVRAMEGTGLYARPSEEYVDRSAAYLVSAVTFLSFASLAPGAERAKNQVTLLDHIESIAHLMLLPKGPLG